MELSGPGTIKELLEASNVVGPISEYEGRFKHYGITMTELKRQILTPPELEKIGINLHSDRMKLLDTQRAMQMMSGAGREEAKQPVSSHWMLPRKFEKPTIPSPLMPLNPPS